MPQGAKTPSEKLQFKWMLENVNILYLSGRVLILVGLHSLSLNRSVWLLSPLPLTAYSLCQLHHCSHPRMWADLSYFSRFW